MVLTCNQLPNVPANDNGTWRRLRVLEFTSKFTDKPDLEVPTEFLADTDLSSKFPSWKESFMALLIHYYKKYTEHGIEEPEEVLACTKEYQRNNDVYLDFVEQEFERSDMAFTSFNQVTNCFKVWLKDNNLTHVSLKKKEMATNFGKIMGKSVSVSNIEGYKGWQFKNSALNLRDELDRNNTLTV
jgi:phage/plasmid-associated DNA primase